MFTKITGSDRRAVGDGQRGTRAGITEDGAKGCEGLLPGGEPVEQQQRQRLEQQRAQEEQAVQAAQAARAAQERDVAQAAQAAQGVPLTYLSERRCHHLERRCEPLGRV